jgi:putative resolvase
MKLSVWAKKQGITYRTAWQYFKDGKLPVKATQLASGTVIIDDSDDSRVINKIAAYARVSSSDQKKDLNSQLDRIIQFANSNGHPVSLAVSEIGSGLNGSRPKLMKLLGDNTVDLIIVEHRDRFARFGFEYIEASMKAQGRKILVMDCREIEDDLVRDMTEVLTSFCARLYGKRAAKRKAAKAIETLANE